MPNQKSRDYGRLRLRVGDLVEVRSLEEILPTLDENAALDALPFMPEMQAYCGKRYRVYKRVDKACDTIQTYKLRRMTGTVLLEGIRCDGSAHGGCQAACTIFWKEAWLRKVTADFQSEGALRERSGSRAGAALENGHRGCPIATLEQKTRSGTGPVPPGEETYSCQATEHRKASSEMAWWDLRQYYRDYLSGNVGLKIMIRGLFIWVFNTLQSYRRGAQYPYIDGKLKKTPSAALNLQPGELVRVKPKDEILGTLDVNYKNRGLSFDREMVKYCGGTYRVLRRVETIINERTGKMMRMPNDCIILDGVICQGDLNKFCPRSIYPYWREIWLERVDSAKAGHDASQESAVIDCPAKS